MASILSLRERLEGRLRELLLDGDESLLSW